MTINIDMNLHLNNHNKGDNTVEIRDLYDKPDDTHIVMLKKAGDSGYGGLDIFVNNLEEAIILAAAFKRCGCITKEEYEAAQKEAEAQRLESMETAEVDAELERNMI